MTHCRPLPVPVHEVPVVVQLDQLTPPFDWTGLFGRAGAVELEIGSGKGLFLQEVARLRPEANFLGVERAEKWFRRAVARFLAGPPANVRLVNADAFDLLTRWIPPESLGAVHIYFPDPWPKRRHAKRRLLQEALFLPVARALSPGAPLFLASDVGEYFAQALRIIERLGLFEAAPWPEDAPDRLPTNYALKYQREGRTLHHAKFLRLRSSPPAEAEVEGGATLAQTEERMLDSARKAE
jgi:tRNA (guanine-N7-)-methyltransferase